MDLINDSAWEALLEELNDGLEKAIQQIELWGFLGPEEFRKRAMEGLSLLRERFLLNNGKQLSELIENLEREFFPRTDSYTNALEQILSHPLDDTINSFFDALVISHIKPQTRSVLLRDEELKVLDRLVKCLCDDLWNESKIEIQIDRVRRWFPYAGHYDTLSNISKIAGYCGFELEKRQRFDLADGITKSTDVLVLPNDIVETIKKKCKLSENSDHREYLHNKLRSRLLVAYGATYRSKLEPYEVNAICSAFAFNILFGLPLGYFRGSLERVPKALLSRRTLDPVQFPLIKLIAFQLNGYDWLKKLMTGEKERRIHTQTVAMMQGVSFIIQRGIVYRIDNPVMNLIKGEVTRLTGT